MSRYGRYSDVATCQDVSILLNCTENSRDVYQQEIVKKVYAGSKSKKNPWNGSLLHVCACVSVVPYPGQV